MTPLLPAMKPPFTVKRGLFACTVEDSSPYPIAVCPDLQTASLVALLLNVHASQPSSTDSPALRAVAAEPPENQPKAAAP